MRAVLVVVALVLMVPLFAGCVQKDATTDGSGAKGRKGAGAVPGGAAAGAGDFIATLPDGSVADPSLLLGLPAVKGEQRYIGASTFEPTLGIDKAGNIFMVAFGGGAKIRKSSDQGATWTDVTAKLPTGQNNPPNSNDPFVYVDRETGRVYTSDLQALVCSWMNWSDDQGKTWTTQPASCGLPFGAHDHQSIVAAKSRGTPSTWANRILYYCVNRVGDSACSTSINGGLTFGPLIPVMEGVDVEAAAICGGLAGHAKADYEGRVFWGKNQCGVPKVGVTEDDGKTWTAVTVSKSVGIRGHDVEIAVDTKNNVYAFWIGSNGLPWLAQSVDHGKTWGKAIMVAPPSITAVQMNAIDAAGEGKIAFTYIGTDQKGGFTATSWEGATWHGYIGIVADFNKAPVVLTTMVDSKDDPIARGACNSRCNGQGDFFDIRIDPQGRPWAAMVDVCNAECLKTGKNDKNLGIVGTLTSGPALVDGGGVLGPLIPVPAAPAAAT